ncbi:LTA synthase family protein [Bacteroidota bacterium]
MIRNEEADLLSIMASFYHALKLDVSTCCYIMIIPFIICTLQLFFSFKILNKILMVYTSIIIIIISLITIVELGVFSEWLTKLHYKSLLYLLNPKEIFQTAQTGLSILLIAILAVIVTFSIYIYKKFFKVIVNKITLNYLFAIFSILVIPAFIFVGIRGGVKPIPISQSEVFYSKHSVLNFAAMNSLWNLAYSITHNYEIMEENPFAFYDKNEVKQMVEKIHETPTDSVVSVLKTKRPNIVILILESWSANIIESISGEKGFTPEFHKLQKEGLLFTNFYACGTRSQQAISAIFSGFPSTPLVDITESIEKYSKLPNMTSKLKKNGYSTSFYFGGELSYGNIKSYLMSNDFDKIVEDDDFDDSYPKGKLGVHDEFVYARHIEDLNNEKQPFLSSVFTLSSHPPYDMPMKNKKFTEGSEKNYLNSIYYADGCLGKYFEEAKKQDWYSNTLFIILADHSRSTHLHLGYGEPGHYKIPLLLYGEVIKDEFKGKINKKIGSQHDIPATLLSQVEISFYEFSWSKNLLNTHSPDFAYYSFVEGLGWVRPDNYFVWDKKIHGYYSEHLQPELKDSIIKEGKSYLQHLFQTFMDM